MPWDLNDLPDLTGTVAVVTGANGGLGLETTRELARRGARVVMAVRDREKAQRAETMIRADVPQALLEVLDLDLASLSSVRQLAHEVLARHSSVDILVANAGVMGIPRAETRDGFEMQFGVNHLGHFLLTALLLPALVRSGRGRVVSVTSFGRFFGSRLSPEDPHLTRGYGPWLAYGQSKLANLQFGIELDRRLAEVAAPVSSLVADPGFTATDLQAHSFRLAGGASQRFFATAVRLIGAPPLRGAMPQLRAATDPDAGGGDLYGLQYVLYGSPVVKRVPRRHRDPQRLRILWEVSERETGFEFDVAAIVARAGGPSQG